MALRCSEFALPFALALALPASARAQDPGPPPGPTSEPMYLEPAPTYVEPPPAPPRSRDIAWSIRFNPLDLVWGKVSLEVECGLPSPFSIVLAPQYMFADPRQSSTYGVTGKGEGMFGEIGYWIDGRALRGYFLKAHLEYNSVKFTSDVDSLTVPQVLVGAMFGSQSVHAGWFTLSWGLGVAYDLKSQERSLAIVPKPGDPANTYVILGTGPLNNGFDFLTQLAIGGSF